MLYDLIVAGGGAGGCFSAIRLCEFYPGAKVCILESARKPLSKVEISGGGRCNVTHACFDPEALIQFYPRGHEVLEKPFREFNPSHLIKWFKEKGIPLKTESDGRVFPVTDTSATIIGCFMKELKKHQIQLWTSTRVRNWKKVDSKWIVTLDDGREVQSRVLLISSGSDQRIWQQLKSGGYDIVSPVPSLFTFNIPDKALQNLMGISCDDVIVSIPDLELKSGGPVLITHWGVSGPAVLKLSAWGARKLHGKGYVFDLQINWLGRQEPETFKQALLEKLSQNPKKYIHTLVVNPFPARLWKYFCEKAVIPEFTSGAEFGKKQMERLIKVLTADVYRVTGKSTFKEEFVTAGGIAVSEIDLRTFGSKKDAGLFFVGEVINIDALTGGFNFQAAWTGAHIAAKAIAYGLQKGNKEL